MINLVLMAIMPNFSQCRMFPLVRNGSITERQLFRITVRERRTSTFFFFFFPESHIVVEGRKVQKLCFSHFFF